MPVPADQAHPLTADVAIVGGGIIGLATAWRLTRAGLSAIVIDPSPGAGASHAAAGMIAPVSEMSYQHGRLFALMRDSAAEYPAFVAALEADAQTDVGYRETETLVCAADPADRQMLADLRQYQQAAGGEIEALTSRAARRLEPALNPSLSGAFRSAGDHQVNPRRITAALQTVLPPIIRHTAVELIATESSSGPAVTGVRLDDGRTVTAPVTVLATGMTATRTPLPAEVALPLRPIRGEVLRTRLPSGLPPLLERTIRGIVTGRPIYLVPRADGEIVIGATSREDNREGPSVEGVSQLLRDAQRLVPGIGECELTEVTARARPGTHDDAPYLGTVGTAGRGPISGLIVANGFYRHGILLTPLASRLAAQLVLRELDPQTVPESTDHPATADTDHHHLQTMNPRRIAHPAAENQPQGGRP